MSDQDIFDKKTELCAIARRCFERGLQTGSGGNLSVRLGGLDAVAIKPSGVGYAECTPGNLTVADFDGNILSGDLEPSKDMPFHLAIYKLRPDVKAIVHVHSPWAIAWASTDKPMPLLALHATLKVGSIPVIPVGPDGGTQTAAQVGNFFKNPNCVAALMERHGSIGVGKSVMAAQYVVELIEETAQIAAIHSTINTS